MNINRGVHLMKNFSNETIFELFILFKSRKILIESDLKRKKVELSLPYF